MPLGTANLTGRALGIPSRAERALEAGFGGRDRQVDLAIARGDGMGGISFTAMAGIGLDAAVVGTARAPHKRRLGGWLTPRPA